MLWSKPVKEELSLSYHLKALHATDLATIIRFLPTLLARILSTLTTTVSGDVAINAIKTLLHFVWQVTSAGKVSLLRHFVQRLFRVDYSLSRLLIDKKASRLVATIHDEIVANLVGFVRHIGASNVQDVAQTIRLLNSCWFFLEIALKSLCIHKIQCQSSLRTSSSVSGSIQSPLFSQELYSSLGNLYESLVELIAKNCVQSQMGKDPEFVSACRLCNKSLAILQGFSKTL